MGEMLRDFDDQPKEWSIHSGLIMDGWLLLVIDDAAQSDTPKLSQRLVREFGVVFNQSRQYAVSDSALIASLLQSALNVGHFCICSGDVFYRPAFIQRLKEVCEDLDSRLAYGYVLAGYSWFNPLDQGLERGRFATRFRPEWYFGYECLIIPNSVREQLCRSLVENERREVGRLPGRGVMRFCQSGVPFLITNRSLVQRLSTGSASERKTISPTFEEPWPGEEEDIEYGARRHAAKLAVEASGDYPLAHFAGRGIVICGGGQKYFPCAFVCVNMLRQLGCQLPIELWYLGADEMTPRMRSLIEPLGVHCIDGRALRSVYPARILNGWELKCYAMLHSKFAEVLLLDADNVAVANPEYLFECKGYKEAGAIFWPDIGRMAAHKDIWRITDVPYRDEPEFESGQALVNKEICWKALNLAMHYNENSDFYYRHVYGDKETFHFAWRRLNQDYAMPFRGIEFLDGTLCQHDLDGRRIFQHRIKKWTLDGNSRTQGFLHERDCLIYLQELRHRWSASDPVTEGNIRLPKIIHTIWLTPENPLPVEYRQYGESWARCHPDWKLMHWTLENLPPMVHGDIFRRLKNIGQKSDLLRYELLHRFGGVYVDTDFECLKHLEPILGGVDCFVGEEDPERLGNAIIGSIPGHPFIGLLLRGIPESCELNAGRWPVDQTGPGYITRVARGREDLTIFPARYFYPYSHRERHRKGEKFPEAFAIHHWAHGWFGQENDSIVNSERVRRWSSVGRTVAEKMASHRLIETQFEYQRIGYDRRVMTFCGDGCVAQGADRCERYWDIYDVNGKLVLGIYSDTELTCQLTRDKDEKWQGKWERHEQMPIVLAELQNTSAPVSIETDCDSLNISP